MILLYFPAERNQELVLLNIQHFRYPDIKMNTFGFHKETLLGQGGFGVVYRARLNETDFAVKKLKHVCMFLLGEFASSVSFIKS